MTAPIVHVVGRLTSDPELRWTPSGHAVATFTVAGNDRRRTPSGEWEDAEAPRPDVPSFAGAGDSLGASSADLDRWEALACGTRNGAPVGSAAAAETGSAPFPHSGTPATVEAVSVAHSEEVDE